MLMTGEISGACRPGFFSVIGMYAYTRVSQRKFERFTDMLLLRKVACGLNNAANKFTPYLKRKSRAPLDTLLRQPLLIAAIQMSLVGM